MNGEDLWAVFYKNQELIEKIDRIIYYFRVQNLDRALRLTGIVLKNFSEIIPLYASIAEFLNEDRIRMDIEYVAGMLNSLLAAQETQDYVLLADLYEMQIRPFLNDIQEKVIESEGGVVSYNRYLYKANYQVVKEKKPELAKALNEAFIPQRLMQEGYTIEYTGSGLPTIKVNRDGKEYYLHSNGNPTKEGLLWARANRITEESRLEELRQLDYADGMKEKLPEASYHYLVFGFGMGYHVKALLEVDPGAKVTVFENDINILQLACSYGDLRGFIEHERFELVYDPDCHALSAAILNESGKLLLYYPSLQVMKAGFLKQRIENYYIQYSSVENQLQHLNCNFVSNITQFDEPVDVLWKQFQGKDLIIVAAGPSLDKNYELLKNAGKNQIVLATGTVLIKLLDAGIRPDYVIMTDANPRIYYQIREHEKESVPAILLSTACKKIGTNYKGKKYLMLQKDYAPAEQMGAANGWTLFETGGSVSTAAIDLGIRFGCKRIITVGLDLSYPDNYAHASGTSRRMITQDQIFREVKDIHGNMVKTNKGMDIYREWIERRIARESGVTFIDATEGGAMIHGMKLCKLSDVIGEEPKKKILVLKGNSKYGVMRHFTDQVIDGFREQGANVEVFDAKLHTGGQLMELVKKDYDLVFAFNGVFTRVDLPESVIHQLTMDGRNHCVSFFVDHPCHHDTRLRVFPPNNHAIFVDREHVELVKEYFPKITPVFLPHGGDVTKGRIREWTERSIDVLFCGSNYDEKEYETTLSQMDTTLKSVIEQSMETLETQHSVTVREAMLKALTAMGFSREQIDFSKESYEQLLRFVDDWIRCRMRAKVIRVLAAGGVKMTICGSGWETFHCEGEENLTFIGNLGYEETNDKMADSRIVLNVMPWFKDGSHERVFTAMRNGAVCVTDGSSYLKEELKNQSSVLFYELDRLEAVPEMIKDILRNPGQRSDACVFSNVDFKKAVKEAKQFADEKHTWKCRAKDILNLPG